jgi:hypothetical protein
MGKDNWKELDGQSVGKSIDRHKNVEKRFQDVKKVISDPDKWNVNIASRERMDIAFDRLDKLEETSHESQDYREKCTVMEKKIIKVEELLVKLNKRIDGLSFLIRKDI